MIPYLIIQQDLTKRQEEILRILSKHRLTKNHPNLLWFDIDDKLGVEAAKKIREHLNLKPYQGKSQAAVLLDAQNLTVEAQNSLLKILEEPPQDALIILGIMNEDTLLPTILSRCQIVREQASHEYNLKNQEIIKQLLTAKIDQRFKLVEELEDRQDFLLSLTIYFKNQLSVDSFNQEEIAKVNNFLKELVKAQRFIFHNVNLRAILEYLMLKLPSDMVK